MYIDFNGKRYDLTWTTRRVAVLVLGAVLVTVGVMWLLAPRIAGVDADRGKLEVNLDKMNEFIAKMKGREPLSALKCDKPNEVYIEQLGRCVPK